MNLDPFCCSKNSKFCCIFFKDKHNNTFVVLNCYRSPSDTIDIFVNNVDSVLNRIYCPNVYFIVRGYFNIDSRVKN